MARANIANTDSAIIRTGEITVQITNEFGLPEAFLRFSNANKYSRGESDISVTTLIDSPRIRKLKERFSDTLSEDLSDNVMSILGSAVHKILEEGANSDKGERVEQRMYCRTSSDIVVSGQVDLMTPLGVDEDGEYNSWKLTDYKTCSAYAVQASPEGKREWVDQLNMYSAIASMNDIHVSELEIVAIIRDWTRSKSERSSGYPEHAIVTIPIPLWDRWEAIRFMEERASIHYAGGLSECTKEEMWERPTQYAVYGYTKSGSVNKRATRVFDGPAEAQVFATDSGDKKYFVKRRPGERVRCAGDFCGVSEHCAQWSESQQQETV